MGINDLIIIVIIIEQVHTVKKYKISWNIESIEKRVCIYLEITEISILVDKGAQEYF